jgi:UDP-glucose:(heptosyl)LPS alpha-1,3-glucosyltransferase
MHALFIRLKALGAGRRGAQGRNSACMKNEKNKTLAFCLFRYFPHGGLQRDMLALATECHRRGHAVTVYTQSWQGPRPAWLDVRLLSTVALTNHGQCRGYARRLEHALSDAPADLIVGFNKMPGLDVYYAADGCYQARALEEHSWLYRLNPRYRQYQSFEEAVFGAGSRAHILMLSKIQEALYVKYYATPAGRIHFLPPNVARDRMVGPDGPQIRQAARREFGLTPDDRLLLQLGSGFRTKGLDRSIRALASLPHELLIRTRLSVVGADGKTGYVRLARQLGVADRVVFLGPRDDVPRILLAADLLVHPAYHENTGTVLLEALAAGLPVVASSVCGYAHYIEEAHAGWVIPEPFDESLFERTVRTALERADLPEVGRRGADFARKEDLYGMVQTAVDVIEKVASQGTA